VMCLHQAQQWAHIRDNHMIHVAMDYIPDAGALSDIYAQCPRAHTQVCVYLVTIPEPVLYEIYTLDFPFDLRYESVTYNYIL